MQDGVIANCGTHAELVHKEEGPYAQMWKRQTENAEEKGAEMSAAADATSKASAYKYDALAHQHDPKDKT